jgi:hypothetical protein
MTCVFKHMSAFGRTIFEACMTSRACDTMQGWTFFQMSIQKSFSQKSLGTVFALKRTHLVCRNAIGLSIYMLCKGSLIISLILALGTRIHNVTYYIAVHKPLRVVTQKTNSRFRVLLVSFTHDCSLLLTIAHIYSRLRIITHDCSHLLTIAHIYSKCLTYVLGHCLFMIASIINSRTLRIESNIHLSLPSTRINQYVTGLLCFLETFPKRLAAPPLLLPS